MTSVSHSTTRQTIRLLAGRWVPELLTELEHSDRRYHDLHEILRGISHKVLTETLRRAERDGLIARTIDSHRLDSAMVYHLTDLGRSLSTPLAALDRWTDTYWQHVETARQDWTQRQQGGTGRRRGSQSEPPAQHLA